MSGNPVSPGLESLPYFPPFEEEWLLLPHAFNGLSFLLLIYTQNLLSTSDL